MIPLWWAAEAAAVQKTVTLCVELDVQYTDLVAGDWWATNAARPFRGGYVTLNDANGTQQKWLGGDGCTTATVNVSANTSYAVVVKSRALINGVNVEGRIGWNFLHHSGYKSTTQFVPWNSVTTKTITLPNEQMWREMAVATWAMYRNDFHLGTSTVNRQCCYGAADPDGTCLTPADYYHPDDNALSTLIAHELGHVVVEKRFDQRTSTDDSANNYGCSANFKQSEIQVPIGDGIPAEEWTDPPGSDPSKKGDFVLEYQSTAAREWAHFFAAWLFNARTDLDCAYNSHGLHDFDLDGDLDDNYGDTGIDFADDDDGLYDCDLDPVLTEPFPSDPLGVCIAGTSMDWLWVMATCSLDLGSNVLPGVGYTGCTAPVALINRSTQYDWLKFWWDMTTNGNIPPEELADLYVDMCPENWQINDGNTTVGDQMVIERLELAAAAAGSTVSTEWNLWRGNGQNH